MSLSVIRTELEGVLIIEPNVIGDGRGFFLESWRADRYTDAGLPAVFVQDNISRSSMGVLRGLHLQEPHAQGKLVQALEGEIFDVAVDVRFGSPTFGQSVGVALSSENKRQIYVSPGFAHGFCVISPTALVNYKCTDFYHPESELGIQWNDPALAIAWPIDIPTLSAKDRAARPLAEIPPERLPRFTRGMV